MAIGKNSVQNLAPLAARTVTTTFGPFSNPHGRSLRVTIKSTAITATPSVTPKIQAVSPAGDATDLLTGTAISTVTTQSLLITPDLAASANAIAQTVAPTRFNVVMTAGDADALTYRIDAEYLS